MLPAKSTVAEIKDYLECLTEEEQQKYLDLLYNDKRKSIQKIVQKYHSLLTRKLAEKERLLKMWEFEQRLYKNNYKHIVGVDEAGRGPLAGPVVAAAVILPSNIFIEGLNDSKKISETNRNQLAKTIKLQGVAWAIGVVDAPTIDRLNILEATRYAMLLAVNSLGALPEYALVDGPKNPLLQIPQTGIIKGDSLSASIAAASIIAKVHRDQIMDTYDKLYPGYAFGINKGYGTQLHIQTLQNKGHCLIHRKTFAPIKNQV